MVKHLAFALSLLPAAVTSSGCSSLVVGVESNVHVVYYCTLHVYVFVMGILNYLSRVIYTQLFQKAKLRYWG